MGISREEIYRQHVHDLTRFACSLVGPSDAADVVSAAVMGAMWSRGWETVTNHRGYLYRAVLNEARMAARSSARRRRREAMVAVGALVPEPDLRPDIADAVARLSFRQRAVVFLTYWEGLPPGLVAERLAISEGSVRRHLARARSRLRGMIHE